METPCEPPTVHDAREAPYSLRYLMEVDPRSNKGATAIKDVEPGSVGTYSSAIRRALYDKPSEEPILWAVERRLNVLAAKGKSGSNAKVLVSSITLPEKLHIMQPIIRDVHWMQTMAVAKRWAHRAQPQPVAPWNHIEAMPTSRGHWACGWLVFLAVCSMVFLWRVGDAANVTWEWISVPGFVTFWDEKRNKKITTYPLSDFLEAWGAYLWKHKPRHVQLRGSLKRSARAVQLFGRLAVLETHTLRY